MPKVPPKPKKIRDNDFDLVRAINDGHQENFHELVRRYEQNLYHFGFRMCGNAPDAEDMVQETFLNVFRYLKDFRYETKFKNWLYRIATSTCIKKKPKIKICAGAGIVTRMISSQRTRRTSRRKCPIGP